MPKAEVAEYFGACLLCREFIRGKAVMIGFDGLCFDCVRDVVEVVKPYLEETTEEIGEEEEDLEVDKEGEVVRVCKKCGEEFANIGKFLAHVKKCGKEGEKK